MRTYFLGNMSFKDVFVTNALVALNEKAIKAKSRKRTIKGFTLQKPLG